MDNWFSHSWDESGLSSCGFCGHVHMGAEPGSELPQSFHSGFRCMTTAVLGTDFNESALVALWKQSLRGTRPIAGIAMVEVGLRAMPTTVDFVSPHNGWRVTQQSTLTGEQHQWRNTQWLLSRGNTPLPPTSRLTPQIRNTAQEWSWGFHSNNKRADPALERAVTTKSKEEALLNIQCRLWSPQHQSHLLSKG